MTAPVASPKYIPRLAEQHLNALLDTQPIAVLMGARQTGKSTLVQHMPQLKGHTYLTLDALDVREQARLDPEGLVRRAPLLILDEVQRAPDVIIALKAAVDALGRHPGQFVLTGSANLLTMKTVKETLAGRASYTTLFPLTRRERLGLGAAGCWSDLTTTPVTNWPSLLAAQTMPPADWRAVARQSNYPPTSLAGHSAAQQADWLQGYIEAYVERDIAELRAIAKPLDFLRLMRAVCANLGQVEKQTTWTELTGVKRSSVSLWADLLEVTYQLVRIPAYSVNRTKRLTKSPKVFWTDTAMALHLAAQGEPSGPHLENMILADLHAWCWSQSQRPQVLHWRTTDQLEVDFVVELPTNRVIPIEVKADSHPGWSDVAGIRAFLDEYADLALGGLVLHGGTQTYTLAPNLVATPWWRVL